MRITDVRRLTGASVGLGLVGLCVVQSASAQIVVDTPITTQVTDTADGQTITVTPSGSITINSADAISSDDLGVTITNDGSIAVQGASNRGIGSLGDNATITNSGTITTQGLDGHGIFSSGIYAIITNSGTITTQGNGAIGILSNDPNATITNEGSIFTQDTDAFGIYAAHERATVTNNGIITTRGQSAFGIWSTERYATIINSGTITTWGEDARGIDSENADAVITNSGTIITQDRFADGIFSSQAANATIANSGTITTWGQGSRGIYSHGGVNGDNAMITNSGAITTRGRDAMGIFSHATNATITSSGTITTWGLDSAGIDSRGDSVTIANSGGVSTQDGSGIYSAGLNAGITNAGTITTQGSNDPGIRSDGDDATIFNSGSIGSSGVGIESQGDNVVITNSGRVVSASGQSIFFEDSPSTLNLLPGSFLGGTVIMDGADTAVNITTGATHSTLTLFTTAGGGLPNFTGGAPVFSGPVPGFYNAGAGQTATYDPTVLARMGGMMQDFAGGISGQIGGRFTPGTPSGTRFANAFAATADQTSEDDTGPFDGFVSTYNPNTGSVHGAWVSGFGSFSSQDGNQAALDSDSWAAGLSVGYDQVINPSLTLGVLAGFSTATLEADSRWVAGTVDHQASGGYAGIYGRYTPSAHGWYVDGALLAGFLTHENVRFVNDNTAPNGVSSARSDYDSWWIAPQLGVGYTHDTAENWTLTPSAQIRLTVQSFDGYSETGPSAANATIGSWTSSSLQTRLQLAASYTGYASVRITGRLGADARTDIGDDSVSTTLIGQTQAMPTFTDDTLSGFVGLDASYALNQNTSLNLTSEFGASGAGTRVSAGLQFRVMF
ncbi:MAG: hypothetical protein Rhims3KO_09720 [Hyphomicrobiales bacterium]